MNLTDWLADVDGEYIDRDGGFPARDPFQCWDLWADYAERVEGTPIAATFTNAAGSAASGGVWHSGLACNVFHNWDRVPALARFDRLSAGATAQPGDVAFWERGGVYAGSHVAIVTADLGASVRCMSQNRGPKHDRAGYETLTKQTLLGYLRPRSKATASSDPRSTESKELTMSDVQTLKEHMEHVILRTAMPAIRADIDRQFAELAVEVNAKIDAATQAIKRHDEHVERTVPKKG